MGPSPLDNGATGSLRVPTAATDLDGMALKFHLTANRYAIGVRKVLRPRASEESAPRRGNAEAETVPMDGTDGAKRLGRRPAAPQRAEAALNVVSDVGSETWGRVQQTVLEANERKGGATAGDIR
jgi:hypothetical protein